MKLFKNVFAKKEVEKQKVQQSLTKEKTESRDDISAIIAASIYLYFQDVHDYENYCLTIKRIDRLYSPWSSKIYGLRKWPKQKF